MSPLLQLPLHFLSRTNNLRLADVVMNIARNVARSLVSSVVRSVVTSLARNVARNREAQKRLAC